jgi:ubiquitin C-terminal hydrolase
LSNDKRIHKTFCKAKPKSKKVPVPKKKKIKSNHVFKEKEMSDSNSYREELDIFSDVSVSAIPSNKSATSRTNKKLISIGIQNIGNSCYINASLQCLRHTSPLSNYFIKHQYTSDSRKSNKPSQFAMLDRNKNAEILQNGKKEQEKEKDLQVVKAFSKIIQDLREGTSAISPYFFKKTISNYNPQFGGNSQSDAQEFLCFLIDKLHDQLKSPLSKKASNSNKYLLNENSGMNALNDGVKETEEDDFCKFLNEIDDSPSSPVSPVSPISPISAVSGVKDEIKSIKRSQNHNKNKRKEEGKEGSLKEEESAIVDIFYGKYKSTIECSNCGHKGITEEPFMSISLPIEAEPSNSISVVLYTQTNHLFKITVTNIRHATVKTLKIHIKSMLLISSLQIYLYNQLQHSIQILQDSQWLSILAATLSQSNYNLNPNEGNNNHGKLDSEFDNCHVFLIAVEFPIGQNACLFMLDINESYPFILSHQLYSEEQNALARLLNQQENAMDLPVLTGRLQQKVIKLLAPFEELLPQLQFSLIQLLIPISQTQIQFPHNSHSSLSESRSLAKEKESISNSDCNSESPHGQITTKPSNIVESPMGIGNKIPNSPLHNNTKNVNINNFLSSQKCTAEKQSLVLIHLKWGVEIKDIIKKLPVKKVKIPEGDKDSDLINLNTLHGCLEKFTKAEKLDRSNQWLCEKCNCLNLATKTIEFVTLPQILILHLKRFKISSQKKREKISRLIKFP